MRHPALPLLVTVCALGAALQLRAQPAQLQSWRPPSQMPSMPSAAELRDGWQASGAWQQGAVQVSGVAAGVRVLGEVPPGRERANFVRFLSGHVPVATWSDRNGDGRADLVEIFRDGAKVIQAVDADYDGACNLYRVRDASGALAGDHPC